jgi:hypothetical protein
MNKGEPNITIPYRATLRPITLNKIGEIMRDLKTNVSPQLAKEIEAAHKEYNNWMAIWEELITNKIDVPTTVPMDSFDEIMKMFGPMTLLAWLQTR